VKKENLLLLAAVVVLPFAVRPAIAAETPTPPKDSLYSLQPTRPSSVLILRKSRLRQPPSACSDSTFVIFITSPLSAR